MRYILEMPLEQRPQFLKFLTGKKRLPLGGFARLVPKLTIVEYKD